MSSLYPLDLARIFVNASHKACQLEFQGESTLSKKQAGIASQARLEAKAQGEIFNTKFARESIHLMNDLDLSNDSLYRAFDAVDDVLGVDYSLDLEMIPNLSERLYEGGGVGVQTSYSSLLTTLKSLDLPMGSSMIDLGSGFGRVGFTLGLLRPDMPFIGYEYVEHRILMSQRVAEEMGFQNLTFITQDLSSRDFKIPSADVYYMFDPFNADTYGYVLNQLIEIGKSRKTIIVTKGRANTWAADTLQNASWTFKPITDLGAIVTFTSPHI